MASIRKRPNGMYRARYRDAAGKEHARHFARKLDAQRWLDEVTASIVTGQYADPRAGRTTVETYSHGWERAQVSSDGTARIVDNALRLHIRPALGSTPIGSVRRSDVQGLVKAMTDSHAPGTVRNVYDVLARMFTSAVDDKVISASPCRRITLPRMSDEEITPPTTEQVAELADTIAGRYRAAVVMLAGSGLRIGELLGLRVADVDFLRRTVRVERQRLQSGALAPPKTPKSVRTVPLGEVVIEELAAHCREYGAGEWLFTASNGNPLTYQAWRSAWRAVHRARQAAENAAAKKAERAPVTLAKIDTHDLRHYFASLLIAGGASPKQVQAALGHSSAVVTLRVYSHLWPGDEDRTRSIVDASLGILRTGCGLTQVANPPAAGHGG